MRVLTILVLLFNVILIGAALVSLREGDVDKPEDVVALTQVEPSRQQEVLTTAQTLGPGTILRPELLTWQSWPDGPIHDAYTTIDASSETASADRKAALSDLTGAVVRVELVDGQPITPRSVVKPGDQGFLAAIIEPGLRAVSIPVSASSMSAGLILPGDKVDVILSTRMSVEAAGGEQTDRHLSETVLRGVRVLAVDRRLGSEMPDSDAVRTASLEVTEEQAEILAMAQDLGRLSVSLHGLIQPEPATLQSGDDPARMPARQMLAAANGSSPARQHGSSDPGNERNRAYIWDDEALMALADRRGNREVEPEGEASAAPVVTVIRGSRGVR